MSTGSSTTLIKIIITRAVVTAIGIAAERVWVKIVMRMSLSVFWCMRPSTSLMMLLLLLRHLLLLLR